VGRLPLHFEANSGQSALPGVDFISRGHGFTVYLTPQGPIMTLREVISARERHRRQRLYEREGQRSAVRSRKYQVQTESSLRAGHRTANILPHFEQVLSNSSSTTWIRRTGVT
jgi:hypothetical protein